MKNKVKMFIIGVDSEMRNMKKQVTKHGKRRLQERINVCNSYRMTINNVRNKGKTVFEYDGKFFYYLSRGKRGHIRIYNNNVYIFAKKYNNHKLITVFPVPSHFFPLERYEIPLKTRNIVNKINFYEGKVVMVILKNNINLYGYVIRDDNRPRSSICLKTKNGKILKIKGSDIVDFKVMN